MKCKNCGGEYRARELKCPYCNTPNRMGQLWKAQRNQAELDYERTRKEVGGIFSPYVLNRLVTRFLIIQILTMILGIGGICVTIGVSEIAKDNYVKNHKAQVENKLDTYLKNGDYRKLHKMLVHYDLAGDEYKVYWQAFGMERNYASFINYRMGFIGLSEEEKMEDTFYLEYSMEYARKVLRVECGLYSDLEEENRIQYDQLCEQATAYLKGTLGITDEEFSYLSDEDYMYSSEWEELVEKVRQRRNWL